MPKIRSSRGCLIAFLITAVVVFVGFIGFSFLAGVAGPSIGAVRKKMKEEQTRTVSVQLVNSQARRLSHQLVNSVSHYYGEYSRYPLPEGSHGAESTPLRSDARLTAALMGTDPSLNARKIRFLPDMKAVTKSSDSGVKTRGSEASVVDPWGEELYILLDANYSGDIENPDPAAQEKVLSHGVLVFSAGPDKDPTTWEDNITSWTRRGVGK